MRSFPMLRPDRVRPPVRRVLAVDAGSRRLKITLVGSSFGRIEILREESVDLHEEGLVNAEELRSHLQTLLEDCGHPPTALTLAQHLSTSQTIELPKSPESEVRKLIEDESVRLSGVSDSPMVYDFVELTSRSPDRQLFWVTLCKERDIEERIRQFGLDQENLCEVTTAANALVAAYRALEPQSPNAVLVHLGAQSTMLVVLSGGQTVFASTFPVGSDSFTRVIAKARGCSLEEAESLQRQNDLLTGTEAFTPLVEFLTGWVAELNRQLNEAVPQRPPGLTDWSSFALVASGAAFHQPGLLDFLNGRAGLNFRLWPVRPGLPAEGFEIAYGTALQALGRTAQPVSLLPAPRRVAWKQRLAVLRIEWVSAVIAVLCLLTLLAGAWRNYSVIQQKQVLLTKVQAGLETVQASQALTADLLEEYERLRPLLERQQNTLDTLETLALLQQSRSNQSFWYVLVADQRSYFQKPVVTATNLAGGTNAAAPPDRTPPELERLFGPTHTNLFLPRPGLIAELCVPEDLDGARRVLSQIVNDLKQRPLFAKVDLLSDDLRRSLADPKVIIPDRHFALALDFAASEFHQSGSGRRSRAEAFGPPAKALRRPTASEVDGEEPTRTP